jgi:alkylation response protein AidB-like acyl-CoA dehydrogenase
LQKEVRNYVDTHIAPFCEEWERQGFVPPEVVLSPSTDGSLRSCCRYDEKSANPNFILKVQRLHAELGYTAVASFPVAAEYLDGQRLPGDINPYEWDGFHDLVVIDELARCGYLGIVWALGCGNSIGGPPVINFGNEEQKRRFLPDMLKGKIRFCLGVTEPDGKSIYPSSESELSAEPRHSYFTSLHSWL